MKTAQYTSIRNNSLSICEDMNPKELGYQPHVFVSPPIWHLGHTTWFFEKIVLENFKDGYKKFNSDYDYLFNSYYNQSGKHCPQAKRGLEIYDIQNIKDYRSYVDSEILDLLRIDNIEVVDLVTIGLNHEEQHQELLHMDIKAIKFDLYKTNLQKIKSAQKISESWFNISEKIKEIGTSVKTFCYDNESPKHKIYQYPSKVASNLITNREFLDFIKDGGYENPLLWLSKGWEWVSENNITEPLYWNDNIDMDSPVSNISYFEANAYANFRGCRLPTEYEHELFDQNYNYPKELWAWTSSPYIAYPGFQTFAGALKEYNGKFMCNQFVLRGGCFATPKNHWRATYRNFYEPHHRWMFSGIRLAKDLNENN